MFWPCWNGCARKAAMSKKLETLLSRISADLTATSATSIPKTARNLKRAMPPNNRNKRPDRVAPQPLPQPPLLAPPAGPPRFTDGVGDPNCPHCHGLGYLREDVPTGHHNFGKLQPCVCQLEHMSVAQANKLRRDSNTETLTGKTFDTFLA